MILFKYRQINKKGVISFNMGNNIIQRLKYKESVVKFSYKYGVTKTAIKYGECRRTIYRWRKKYDGRLESLKDKSRMTYRKGRLSWRLIIF